MTQPLHLSLLRVVADNCDAGGLTSSAAVVRRALDEMERLRDALGEAADLLENLAETAGPLSEGYATMLAARCNALLPPVEPK